MWRTLCLCLPLVLITSACDSDADDIGIGGECTSPDDCPQDDDLVLQCLTNFKGGYCGLSNCTSDADCPELSLCVTHSDTVTYCFRACTDKSECNVNRTTDNEANCSSNITRVDGGTQKACVPPSAS